MTDTPTQTDISAVPPADAGATLAPTTPAEARARIDQLTDNREWAARGMLVVFQSGTCMKRSANSPIGRPNFRRDQQHDTATASDPNHDSRPA